MALDEVAFARMLVDGDTPRARDHAPDRRHDARAARARALAAGPGRAALGDAEDARAPHALDPGARHEPRRSPAAAGRRCRQRRRARLPRARDDRAAAARRAAQRRRAARRRAGAGAGRAHAVRGRGAPRARARHARPHDLRRDGLGLRHRAGLRRRRRHALVEGVPRLVLRLARPQDALHLGLRGRVPDGRDRGLLDALPRGALPRGDAGGRLAGHAERRHRRRQRRRLGARRHARGDRREPARDDARPRVVHRQRHADVVLRHPPHRAHAAAAAGGLRLPVLGLRLDPGLRQRVRPLQLQRRGHRRLPRRAARLGLRGRAAPAVRRRAAAAAPARGGGAARGARRARPGALQRRGCRGGRAGARLARRARRSTRTSCPMRPTSSCSEASRRSTSCGRSRVRGFEVEAERVLDMLRQRLYGDYLPDLGDLHRGHEGALGALRPERLRGAGHRLPHDGRAPRRDRRRAPGVGAGDARRRAERPRRLPRS